MQAPTIDDLQKIFPEAPENSRIYSYPAIGVTPWAVCEWQHRRVNIHCRAAHWVAGIPTRKPDRGWPLYMAGSWETSGVFLVATEREASALHRMGLDATTWHGGPSEMQWADWGSLDGIGVMVWMPDDLARQADRHLWRHCYVPASAGEPLQWLKSAWERHQGDRGKIREDVLWMAMESPPLAKREKAA